MSTKFRKDLNAKVQQAGLRVAPRWLLQYLTIVPDEHIEYNVFARSLQKPLPNTKPLVPITMRLATKVDLPRFRDLVLPSEYQQFARRLAHGRLCFLAFPVQDPDKLIAYCWATTEINPDIDALATPLTITIPENPEQNRQPSGLALQRSSTRSVRTR